MRAFKRSIESKQHVKHSLKGKTWRFFLIIFSLFCVIFVTSYVLIMVRASVDNAVSNSETAMTSLSSNIKANFDRYKEMSRLIMLNKAVVDYLNSETLNQTTVSNGIISITNIYSYVDSIYVFRLDDRFVRTGSGLIDVDEKLIKQGSWRQPLLSAKGGVILSINGRGAFKKRTGIPLISMMRLIYDIETQKEIGLLVINLNPNVLYTAAKDLSPDSQTCFFDKEGNYLWGDEDLKDKFNAQDVNRGFQWQEVDTGGKRDILSSYSTPDSPVVQVSNSAVTAASIQSSETILLVITLITAVILSVFASGAFISSNIARPIDMLAENMTSTKTEGELHEIHLSLPNNEIRNLADSYNSMIAHINHLIAELIEKENSIRKAEMRTLQEQIKPHFLYNSLETISYMALQSDAPSVHDALETLGSFYRNFLSKGSREIPLRSEILIIKDYLALQKLRYGDAFDDEYYVEEGVLGTLIPKLILQPLVENSLYHGVRLKGEKGVIRISAFEKDGAVHITVFDTGVGMSKEKIADILKGSTTIGEDELSGFGLKGTIERIRYYCNYQEVIQIRSEPGEYTAIEIIIPKER